MRYILLLRGINVGGKHQVSMGEMKELLRAAGFEEVDSYINSGNLFFTSDESLERCISKIACVLENRYDFSIPFALLTEEEFVQERAALPDWWKGPLARRDVLFFSCDLVPSEVLAFVDTAPLHHEIIHVGKHAVFWGHEDASEFLKSAYHKKIMKQNFYKKITIRNGNTFENIADLLEKGRKIRIGEKERL